MNPGIAEVPSRQEVERQLERMLASKLFRVAQKQARIFRYAVQKALDDIDISEKDISYDVFGGYDPDLDKVRVNITLLRSRIHKYYDGMGGGDLVAITLPPGPAYRPVFSYGQHSVGLIHYRRGLAHLSDPLRTSLSISEAIDAFSAALKAEPTFAPAYVRKSESELLAWMLSDAFDVAPPFPQDEIDAPEVSVGKALELDPQLALAHIIRGVVHAVAGEWQDAEKEFSTALTLDSVETQQSWWYATYLLTVGRREEAFRMARSLVKENLENRNGMLVYALFLYVVRQYDDALQMVQQAWGANELFKPAGERPLLALLSGLIHLARDRPGSSEECKTALSWLQKASEVTDTELQLIGTVYEERPERFGGLLMLCLSRLAEEVPPVEYPPNWPPPAIKPSFSEQASKLLAHIESGQYTRPFQLAVVQIALGKKDKGITTLRAAAHEDVLTRWLHLWPFLDPLRDRTQFHRLIEEFGIVPIGPESP